MVKAFEVALEKAGKEKEICIYEQADHALPIHPASFTMPGQRLRPGRKFCIS
jgi:hypothetical protein